MTIWEIDKEIEHLKKMKEAKEREMASKNDEYVGKLYRQVNGSIGKITERFERNGEVRFRGVSLWFDDEDPGDYEITQDTDELAMEHFEIITQETFHSILQGWVQRIEKLFGVIGKDTSYEGEEEIDNLER